MRVELSVMTLQRGAHALFGVLLGCCLLVSFVYTRFPSIRLLSKAKVKL
jgi:hypothetical protein